MKKNVKKIMKSLSIFILGIVLFSSAQYTVNAVSQTIKLGSSETVKGYVAGFSFSTKKTTDGVYLYCLDYHKYTAKNVTAKLVGQRDAGIAEIIKNGYPNKSITGDKYKDYYITQTAIWWYLDNTTGSSNLKSSFKTGSDSYNLRSKIKNLVALGEAAKKKGYPSTKLDISVSDTSMTLSNGYYVSKDIKASTISNISSYTVELVDAPTGAEIIDSNGNLTNTITGSNTFKVRIPASKVTSTELSIKVKATGTGTVSKAYEYQPTNKSMQNVAPSILDVEKITKTDSLTLELTTTKVTIVKVDQATGEALAGATLVVKDVNGNQITEPWVSTTNGHVIRNLTNGTYTVEELEAPNGYKLNKTPVTFSINNSNRDVKVTIENEVKTTVVNIIKVDASTNQPLAGAVLVLTKPNGEQIEFETTTEPYVITDLEDGTYTLEEKSAPAGYMKSSEKISFTIDDDHLSHQITFQNHPEVYVPDTASNSIIFSLIGIAVIAMGIGFVYRNGKKAK